MGKAGRAICIFTPYVLTIASLVCIIMVGLGCTNSGSSTLNNLYFFRADLQNFTTSSETKSKVSSLLSDAGIDASSSNLSSIMDEASDQLNLADFYTVGLWGYCDGNVTSSNKYDTSSCSKPKAAFYFNPFEVWGLQSTGVESQLPDGIGKALSTYKSVSKWMFIAYIIAFIATIVELVVGLFAICSRWGSCITSLIAGVAFFFIAAASATSTALFAVLTPMFNEELSSYGVKGSMGKNMLATTWLAVAFSLAASLFWIISSCCCSGRSPYNHKKDTSGGITAEKAPYTYEPLGPQGRSTSPYGPYSHDTSYPPPPPTHGNANAYEPFRHA
ncbi:SUR7/PalI family protein [Aspergillus glaucus CBS 516.65]|uniref:Uncharacterized protein n=1 Tax=Aspergillus glaucus CBS 516.65 TaxID=1160497 RepID=A0A1L9VZD7_ASPGL|nr:hypothetical protein ASPGLDRAFT_62831 [Aspergillus glaucus CBS 516.65]OJJ89290.1 hypothetical protein ASPGLDRAFT_62831 [Aspergillus glaucus CBS 516.65]